MATGKSLKMELQLFTYISILWKCSYCLALVAVSFIFFIIEGFPFRKLTVSLVSLILFCSYSYLLCLIFPQLAVFEFLFMPSFLQPLSLLFLVFIIFSITKLWIILWEVMQLHGNQLFGTSTVLACWRSPWVNRQLLLKYYGEHRKTSFTSGADLKLVIIMSYYWIDWKIVS